jgi:hypothetical protein
LFNYCVPANLRQADKARLEKADAKIIMRRMMTMMIAIPLEPLLFASIVEPPS